MAYPSSYTVAACIATNVDGSTRAEIRNVTVIRQGKAISTGLRIKLMKNIRYDLVMATYMVKIILLIDIWNLTIVNMIQTGALFCKGDNYEAVVWQTTPPSRTTFQKCPYGTIGRFKSYLEDQIWLILATNSSRSWIKIYLNNHLI